MLSASIVIHGSVSPFEEEDFSQFENKPVAASIYKGKIPSFMGIVFFIGKVKVDIQSKVEKNY